MSDKISVNPLSVRGLGNVVSPKLVSDYDVFNVKLASSSVSINDELVNVFNSSLIESNHFDEVVFRPLYSLDVGTATVSCRLLDSWSFEVGGVSVKCIVNDTVVYTSVTDSDGYASFSIDLTLDTVNVYKCKLVYEGNASMGACWYDFMFWHGDATELDLTGDMMFIAGSDEAHFLATLTGLDNQGNKLGVPGQVISFYELYTLGVLLGKPSDVLKGGTVPLSARLVDSEDYSRLFFEGELVSFYEYFIRDKVVLNGSNQFIKANEKSALSAKVLDTDGSYISDVPVYFEEDITGKFAFGGLTGNHVLIGETTGLSVPLYSDVLLESATVSCDTDGTNYCYSIGFDELGLDLSSTDFTLEFDYRNTVNGGRLCLGDASSWSTGRGAGDNYIYIGTSTAGNGGYGTKTSGATDNTSTGAVSVDTLMHWKIVRSGNTLSYYLDGTLKGTKSVPDWVADCTDWSLYFQCWNNGDFTVRNVSLDMGSDNDLSGFFVRFYVDEPEGVDDEVIIPVAEEPEPVVTSVVLTGDKSLVSAYDSDTVILSATVKDQNGTGMSGQSVVFKRGSTTLATKQTNSSGVASYTYSAAGSGDVSFTASVGSIVSGTYSIEDCIIANVNVSYTGTSTSDTVYSLGYDEIADLSSIDFEMEWTFRETAYGCDVCLGASSEFSVTPIKSNYRVLLGNSGAGGIRYGYRTTSTNASTTSSIGVNTDVSMRIVKNGTSFEYYVNGNLLGTKTVSFWTNYHMFGLHTVQWNTGTTTISNLKIKPL